MNGTIIASCGEVIPIGNIDSIGIVKQSICIEPVYKRFFWFDVHWSDKEIFCGYEFVVHTTGKQYFWINRDTEQEAEYTRETLIQAIDGFIKVL